jgi:DNA mismatch endonuclease (patch repair protein)
MTDIVDKKTRSRMMSGIRGKNTKPELLVRKGLHKRGYRYKLHDKKLPGKPDLVFPKFKAVIQVNGCFWHKHNCHIFKWPKSRADFWKHKILGNVERDKKQLCELESAGWRVLIVWECCFKGKSKLPVEKSIDSIVSWLEYGNISAEIKGKEI